MSICFYFENNHSIFFNECADAEIDLRRNNCNANSDNGLVSECSPNTEAEQVSNSVEKKRLVAGGNEEQQQNRDQLKVCVQSRSHAILGEKLFSSLSLIIFNLRRIQVF